MTDLPAPTVHETDIWGSPRLTWGPLADVPERERLDAFYAADTNRSRLPDRGHTHDFSIGTSDPSRLAPVACATQHCHAYPRERNTTVHTDRDGNLLHASADTIADQAADVSHLTGQIRHLVDAATDPEIRSMEGGHIDALVDAAHDVGRELSEVLEGLRTASA